MAAVPFAASLVGKPSPPLPLVTAFRRSPPVAGHRLIRIRSSPVVSARRVLRSAGQENGGASETQEEKAAAGVAEEIKAMMEARKKKEEGWGTELLGGVAEEVREIEWPALGKVVGTTGVVLAVIAGSSVALLTVNAILAEVSDRVFAGRGIQDLFG